MNGIADKKEPVLVVLAAGIGSRYGAGVKQLAGVGPCGEIILDYSVFDAIKAGFKKVIFIIRREIETDFREIIGDRLSGLIDVEYAFQDPDDLPEGFMRPELRTKPWGTGHAVLSCRGLIDSPFAVINADDYYGSEAFTLMYAYLKNEIGPDRCSMVSFILGNTLSDNGTVTRGVCVVNGEGGLTGVHETKEIRRGEDGVVRGTFEGETVELAQDVPVSMNFWGFDASFISFLETGFADFLRSVEPGDIKSEYLLPVIVDGLLAKDRITVDVKTSGDRWFGITYREDKETVTKKLADLTAEGKYPSPLFNR